MARLVTGLLALALLAGAFLLPTGNRARLAALEAHELFGEPVLAADGSETTLGELVLAGPAARTVDGTLQLELYGVRLWADAQADLGDNLELRRSIVRGLRATAANAGHEFELVGELAPEKGGANFYLEVGPSSLLFQYTVDDVDTEVLDVRVEKDWAPPSNLSLLPPLVAVALAVFLRRPLLALFVGVLSGSYLIRRGTGAAVIDDLLGAPRVATNLFFDEFESLERLMIIGFVVFMLAMVGVMTRSGGIRGLMDLVAGLARDARRTQIATYLMGLAIFFDDYANTILVGSTMRPLSDRFRVAREKLAYIVDSTAAPVAGLSVFSTWIAFEVSTFNAHLPAAGLLPSDGYAVFLRTIPYSFYCILTLVFVGLIAWTGRDFGPMLSAERRARSTGKLLNDGSTPMVSDEATHMEAEEGVTPAAWRALAPLATFLGVTLFEIFRAGGAFAADAQLFSIEGITAVLYNGSGSRPLLIGSLAGFLVAAVGAFSAGLFLQVFDASWKTLRSMGVAFAILYLAWMIGSVCGELGTAPYLTSLLSDAVDPLLLPTLLFVLAGLVAFATGSSWSTMSILLPLVVGLAYTLGSGTDLAATGAESGQLLMVMSIAAVLSGAIFGDHCSPISDTTVMSSIASASDHIDHVRTQAPYAIVTMLAAILTGYLPCAYAGLSPWLALLLGSALLLGVLFLFGRKSEAA